MSERDTETTLTACRALVLAGNVIPAGPKRDRVWEWLADLLDDALTPAAAVVAPLKSPQRLPPSFEARTVAEAVGDAPQRETRPAPAFEKQAFHWLVSERATGPAVAVWMDGHWWLINENSPVSPDVLATRGWVWHSAIPLPPGLKEEGD